MSYFQIDHVNKSFGDAKVLKDITLSMNKGELVTLLGPSGCGKSTLLRAIAGLVDIDDGSILVDGIEITNRSPKDREVGMVFQSYALFPNMTVFDNIAFGLKMKGVEKVTVKEKVQRMIELVDLVGKENAYPRQLSGGQQQRVALARSLVIEPKILLLDEPLSALDAKIRKVLQFELRKIQKELNITTIFVTHDQEEAMTISDRIYVLNEGEIAQVGTPQEIYTSPKSEFVARFIGNYNVLTEDQLVRLFGKDDNGIEIAGIRPEVIRIAQKGQEARPLNHHVVEGSITGMTMIGSILRYKIECNHVVLDVDQLHYGYQEWNIGDKVQLLIPNNEIIILQQAELSYEYAV